MKIKDKLIGAGVGLAALAAAAAYFLLGKRGEENRELLARWGLKAKERLLDEVKEIQRTGESGPKNV